MANSASAKKRIRQQMRRTAVNTARISRIRTFIKRVERAIAGGDQTAAQDAFRAAQPEIMRGANKGVLHRNTVARRLSRLSRQIKSMSA